MRYFRIILAVFCLALLYASWSLPDGRLRLIFCNVGQGDAALVTYGGFQALIDTGPKNGGVLSCLSENMPFWDHKIELLINSHPEADHLGDLPGVIDHYHIGVFAANGKMPKEKMAGAIKQMEGMGTKVIVVATGDALRYSDLRFEILWPEERDDGLLAWLSGETKILGVSTELNRYSVVARLSHGEASALLTGDISTAEEDKLVEMGKLKSTDVLKAAHHGSKYSTGEVFLAAIRPSLTVFSAGKNTYGHPTEEALGRSAKSGSKIWRTDKQGELVLVSDAKEWRIE